MDMWLSAIVPGYVSNGEVFPEEARDDAHDKLHFSNGYSGVAELEEKLLQQAFPAHGLRPIPTGNGRQMHRNGWRTTHQRVRQTETRARETDICIRHILFPRTEKSN